MQAPSRSPADIINASIIILALFYLGYIFRFLLTSEPIPSSDLPGHIAAIERLRPHLLHGRIIYYDSFWFGGVTAFYCFLPHVVAALLSIPLETVTSSPVELSLHLMLYAGICLLPLSLRYAAVPFARNLFAERSRYNQIRWLLSLCAFVLAHWFLNHESSHLGFGANAVIGIGLFPQLFGWHVMLLHSGMLFRLVMVGGRREMIGTVLATAVVFFTHPFTAFYSLFIASLSFLWFGGSRMKILVAHLIGAGMTAFWYLPVVYYAGEFGVGDTAPPQGDILKFLFKYPLSDLLAHAGSFLRGLTVPIDFTYPLIGVLLCILIASPATRGGKLVITGLAFSMLAALVLTGTYAAASFPVTIHYQRFPALIVLHFLAVLAVAPLALFSGGDGAAPKKVGLRGGAVAAVLLLCFTSSAVLPPQALRDVSRPQAAILPPEITALMATLAKYSGTGRVFFERIDEHEGFSRLSLFYPTAKLANATGTETVNGPFVMSSIAYRLVAETAYLLGARVYRSPLLFAGSSNVSEGVKIAQLMEFGVDTIVTTDGPFFELVKKYGSVLPAESDRYRIVRLPNEHTSPVRYSPKQFVGYVDKQGTLPFKFLEYYFFSQEALTPRFELLQLQSIEDAPPQLDKIIVNDSETLSGGKIVAINFQPHHPLDHFAIDYAWNHELRDYESTRRYLNEEARLPATLVPATDRGLEPNNQISQEPVLKWTDDFQSFTLTGLVPQRLVRINYSYFPYWNSDDGTLFRGSEERMFFLAKNERATFTFNPWHTWPAWLGAMLSVLSLGAVAACGTLCAASKKC